MVVDSSWSRKAIVSMIRLHSNHGVRDWEQSIGLSIVAPSLQIGQVNSQTGMDIYNERRVIFIKIQFYNDYHPEMCM